MAIDLYWDNVVTLLHFDGYSGSTTFTDSSSTSKDFSATGNAQLSLFSRFGTASALFDGTGDWISTTTNLSDYAFGTGDFTVEGFFYLNSLNKVPFDFGWSASSGGWQVYIDAAGYIEWWGGNSVILTSSITVPISTWVHIAITRASGSLRVFINGALGGTVADGRNYTGTSCTAFVIGAQVQTRNPSYDMNGWIDEVRITKGTARYTSADPYINNVVLQLDFNSDLNDSSYNGFTSYITPTVTSDTGNAVFGAAAGSFIGGYLNGGYLQFNNPTGVIEAGDRYVNNVVLLMHADSSDLSTIFTDHSLSNHAFTETNSATISTSQAKFGCSSLSFLAPSSFISSPAHTDWNFGSGDFTAECWFYANSSSATGHLFGQWEPGNHAWHVTTGATLSVGYETSDTGSYIPAQSISSSASVFSLNTWNHIAFTRSGTSMKLFLNGSLICSSSFAGSIYVSPQPLTIGHNVYPQHFNGYIDEIRFTKGISRYSTTFTPSTIPFNPELAPFDFGGSNFTIESWVKFTSASIGSKVYWFGKASNSGTLVTVEFYKNTSNAVTASITTNVGTYTIVDPTPVVASTNYFYAVTRSGNILTLYRDAVSVASTTISGSCIANSYKVGIGCDGEYTSVPLTGDPYFNSVSMLLHGDGTNGSTTFTDTKVPSRVFTVFNGAQISTAQSKFGGSSMYFGGVNSYIRTPNTTDLQFIAGDFTLECWFNCPTFGGWSTLFENGVIGVVRLTSSNYVFGSGVAQTLSTSITLNVWHHIAFCGKANTLTVWLDGALVSTLPSITSYYTEQVGGNASIGYATINGAWPWTGYIDDFRITKGVAKYTTGFVPSTLPAGDFQTPLGISMSGWLDDFRLTKGIARTITLPSAAFPKYIVPTVAFPGAYDSYWSNVSLLLHGNGVNGSVSVIDSSSTNKAVTAVGNAQISTAQSKFGGASIYFDGSGDYLSVPDSADLNFATGDWTVELWVYLSVASTGFMLLNKDGQYGVTYPQWRVTLSGTSKINCYIGNGTSGSNLGLELTGTTTVTTGAWHHIAIVKYGTQFTGYLDGVQEFTGTAGTAVAATRALIIGYEPGGLATYYFNGYMDDIRITKGVARYTAAFTPPLTEFSNVGAGGVITTYPSLLLSSSLFNTAPGKTSTIRIVQPVGFANKFSSNFSGFYKIAGHTIAGSTPFAANVLLFPQSAPTVCIASAQTDSVTGAFSFLNLAQGNYLIAAIDNTQTFRRINYSVVASVHM